MQHDCSGSLPVLTMLPVQAPGATPNPVASACLPRLWVYHYYGDSMRATSATPQKTAQAGPAGDPARAAVSAKCAHRGPGTTLTQRRGEIGSSADDSNPRITVQCASSEGSSPESQKRRLSFSTREISVSKHLQCYSTDSATISSCPGSCLQNVECGRYRAFKRRARLHRAGTCRSCAAFLQCARHVHAPEWSRGQVHPVRGDVQWMLAHLRAALGLSRCLAVSMYSIVSSQVLRVRLGCRALCVAKCALLAFYVLASVARKCYL